MTEPPRATPRPPTVTPSESAIPTITPWTPADITPEAAPARPTRGPSKLSAKFKGFRSKAQWRWAFAAHKPWAHKAARETKGGPKARYRLLPERKGPPTLESQR